jgi:hypothetical protein
VSVSFITSVSSDFVLFQASAIIPILAYMACDLNMRRALFGPLEQQQLQMKRKEEKCIQLTDLK